ncbi:MAG: exodeoxyribonuclease VII large subunit [Oscillospiraceae bacterium]|nr:exodeoxyribonuclease VII large subunit [Candidatus Limimonas egerieequi]
MQDVTPEVYSVAQLNNYVKSLMDYDLTLKALFLVGEISNFKAHSSGHMYMTLKDDKSSIKAVMFRGNASKLKFMPSDGMKIIAFGSVSVFERDGAYQFYIENMQPDGVGSLSIAFEQLKEKLQKEGLFDTSAKKPLPKYPKTVGVVTSPTGAAFQDICNVLGRRWPMARIVISPALVQGETAPRSIVEAIEDLDASGEADVIIVARGGGSIEDFWCFNDERVARAIFDTKTPIISGVGHETDFTIADFVADMRAPTPSAAAEIVVPDVLAERDHIMQLTMRSQKLMLNRISTLRTSLNLLTSRNVMQGPVALINERRLLLDNFVDRMNAAASAKVSGDRSNFVVLASKLDAFSPLKVLSRGYSITEGDKGVIKSVEEVSPGDKISIRLNDGTIRAEVE